ncbi:MAG: hypothetical protein ACKON9_01735 [Planctomycetaceae bacterium]
MKTPRIIRWLLFCFAGVVLLAVSGWWWTNGIATVRSDEQFIPEDFVCQVALRQAFDAWLAGAAAGPVSGTVPLVHVTDSSRVSQRPLLAYEILGRVPGNAPSCFAVRLQLDQPPEERRERFVVIGIDPLWVFRHEDYDLLLHWEHPMDKNSDNAQADPKGVQQP